MTAIEPSWRPDPSGRHQYRYWDGSRWTDAVADNGIQSSDKLGQLPVGGETTAPIGIPPGPAQGPVPPTFIAWYEQPWFIVVTLLFCFPVGFIFVWRKPWQQGVKIAITAAVGILFIGIVVAGALSPKKQGTNAAPPAATTSTPATEAPPTTLSPAQARQQAAARLAAAKAAAAARRVASLRAAAAAQAAAKAKAAAAAAAQVAYLKAHAPVVVWQQSGSGQASGPQFTVPSSDKGWDEVWSYDCSNFGSQGNFQTYITGYGDAALTTDAGSNELGPGGSGTNHYYDTGTFSIQVNSECNWSEKIFANP